MIFVFLLVAFKSILIVFKYNESAFFYAPDILLAVIVLLEFLRTLFISNKKIIDYRVMEVSLIAFLLLLCALITCVVTSQSLFLSIKKQLILLLPLLVLVSGLSICKRTKSEFKFHAFVLIAVLLFLSAFGIANFEPTINKGVTRLPILFSNLHSTAYTLLSLIVVCIIFIFTKFDLSLPKRKFLSVTLFLFLYFCTLEAWGVRTTFFCVMTFFIMYNFSFQNFSNKLILMVIYTLAAAFLLVGAWIVGDSLNSYSSGRIEMYGIKFFQFIDGGFEGWIFGQGAGSDLIKTQQWWWSDHGAHNDYISIIIENGLLYLGLFLLFIHRIFKMLSGYPIAQSLLVAYLASGLISNGFLARPFPAYILCLGIIFSVIWTVRWNKEVSK